MVAMDVLVNTASVAEGANGWTFDAPSNVVTLNGSSCTNIQNADDPASMLVEVSLTCEYVEVEP
jgi:hypothetical protein